MFTTYQLVISSIHNCTDHNSAVQDVVVHVAEAAKAHRHSPALQGPKTTLGVKIKNNYTLKQ